jgi:hypothetical protein
VAEFLITMLATTRHAEAMIGAGFAVDDGVVVLAPEARVQALDPGLHARLA